MGGGGLGPVSKEVAGIAVPPQGQDKVGHLQPFYLFLSRLGCSLGELQDVRPDKFCQA